MPKLRSEAPTGTLEFAIESAPLIIFLELMEN